MITRLFNTGYICGALVGNGSIKADPGLSKYAIFLESKNKEFAESFAQRLEFFIEKSIKKYERTRGSLKLYTVVHYPKKDVLGFAEAFRFRQGAFNWNVPQQCYEDKHFRRGFLQGYFDAKARIRIRFRKKQKKGRDSRFDKVRSIKISSVNKRGLLEIKALLDSFGIGCTISQSSNNFIMDIEGKQRVSAFRDKIGFGISEKKNELDRALEKNTGM